MTTKKRSTKKGNVVSVDFTDVEAGGGGGRLLPEGPVLLELVDIEEKESDAGNPYLAAEFQVPEGEEFAKTKAYDNFSLQPQALWKLRGFLEAAGVETEDGPMDLDLDGILGSVVMADIIHEDYKGKPKHRVNGYSPSEDSEPEEKPEKKSTSKKVTKKEEEPEDGEDEGDDDQPEFKKRQRVSFKDGKKTLTGVVTEIDGDTITVKVGNDEYEMGAEDLTPA